MKHGNSQKGRIPVLRERLLELQGEMSNTEFADKLGLSRQTVGFYLNGDRIPDSETLIQICKSCKVSADWLLGLSNDPLIESYTVDELGLTPESVQIIRESLLREDAKDFLNGINMLLTAPGIYAIAKEISGLALYVDIEKESVMGVPRKEFTNDLTAELMNVIIDERPDLHGRFYVQCADRALDARLNTIVRLFEYAVGHVTGYSEYKWNNY